MRRRVRGRRVVELAAGHALVAHLLLLLDDTSAAAVAVDPKPVPSAVRLHEALLERWPRLAGRVERRLEDLRACRCRPTTSSSPSTPAVLSRTSCSIGAISARAPVALLPCCHDARTCDTGGLLGFLPVPLAVDATRVARLRAAGYDVSTQTIPAEITPHNRLILGLPRRGRATAADASTLDQAAEPQQLQHRLARLARGAEVHLQLQHPVVEALGSTSICCTRQRAPSSEGATWVWRRLRASGSRRRPPCSDFAIGLAGGLQASGRPRLASGVGRRIDDREGLLVLPDRPRAEEREGPRPTAAVNALTSRVTSSGSRDGPVRRSSASAPGAQAVPHPLPLLAEDSSTWRGVSRGSISISRTASSFFSPSNGLG